MFNFSGPPDPGAAYQNILSSIQRPGSAGVPAMQAPQAPMGGFGPQSPVANMLGHGGMSGFGAQFMNGMAPQGGGDFYGNIMRMLMTPQQGVGAPPTAGSPIGLGPPLPAQPGSNAFLTQLIAHILSNGPDGSSGGGSDATGGAAGEAAAAGAQGAAEADANSAGGAPGL